MNSLSVRRFSLIPALASLAFAPLVLRANTTNLSFSVPAKDAAEAGIARSRDSFDAGWRFARFGLQPEGGRKPEPGVAAWNITASASSEEAGNPAAAAFDGDAGTRWCADGGAPAQWLALDLGKPVALGSVAVTWEKNSGYTFVIEGSSDGVAWKQLAKAGPETKSGAVLKISGTHRRLRVRTTALPGPSWASISEIRLTDASGAPVTRERVAGDSPTAETPDFDDSGWRKLDLPHDWGIEGPFRSDLNGDTGKLPWKGIGWYRKYFALPEADRGRRVFLDFDGAMAYAKVWINGHELPAHPYGYTAFRLDLTPYLNFGDKPNLVAVRLDTENWDSRWYPGAGIYRHTWLVKTNPVHIANEGVTLTTPKISAEAGEVKISILIENQSKAPAALTFDTDIYELNPDNSLGKRVVHDAVVFAALVKPTAAGETWRTDRVLSVPDPKLWDLATPNRYLARTTVYDSGSNTIKVVDTYDTPFGFRTLDFTARDGFKLNGKRVPVRGVCMHHDLGALGAALNDRALERQLEELKAMGCNAIRTSHNPPSTELLDLADRMGFLVQVEAFDCWAHGKRANDYNKLWKAWHETDLRDMVKRARNHPSVFMWSIGNEVMEQTDVALTKHLVDIVHSEDMTRPASCGYNNPDGGRASGASASLDVMGVNYFFGQQDKWDKDPRYAKMPTIGSETSSCISSRGEYFFGTNRADWQITSYDCDFPGWGCSPDTQFSHFKRWPHLLGEFVWTGFDYLGEPTPYNSGDNTQMLNFRNDPAKRAEVQRMMEEYAKKSPPSRSSYFGIIDLAGFPKDRFYSYQAHWRPDLPVAHLFPHWNWPERVGKVTPVHLYTSGDEAELFLNGKSLGRKKRGPNDYRLKWEEVKYEPGELKVVAYKAGKKWAEETVKTTGPAAKLLLTADRSAITPDGLDLAFVTVRVADIAGLTVPRTHNLVKFSVSGPGEIVATDNGDATDFESFQLPQHKAFNGLLLAIVKLKPGATGPVTIHATADGLAAGDVTITPK